MSTCTQENEKCARRDGSGTLLGVAEYDTQLRRIKAITDIGRMSTLLAMADEFDAEYEG
jgi:hypothetical protein